MRILTKTIKMFNFSFCLPCALPEVYEINYGPIIIEETGQIKVRNTGCLQNRLISNNNGMLKHADKFKCSSTGKNTLILYPLYMTSVVGMIQVDRS